MKKTKGERSLFITKTSPLFSQISDVGILTKIQQISTLAKFHTILSQNQLSVVSANFIFQILTILTKSKQCLNLTAVITFVIISTGFSVVRIFWIMTPPCSRISRTK